MPGSAKTLRTWSKAAQDTKETNDKTKLKNALPGLMAELEPLARAGADKFQIISSHKDYPLWNTAVGKKFLESEGFVVTNYQSTQIDPAGNQVLELSWEKADQPAVT